MLKFRAAFKKKPKRKDFIGAKHAAFYGKMRQ
jgi:hypothetical protein